MKKFLLPFLAVVFLLTSCGTDPVKYNDTLVAYTKKAVENYSVISKNLDEAADTEDYSKISAVSQSVVDSISSTITTIKTLEIPSDGEEFQKSVVKYLEALSDLAKSYDGLSILNNADASEDQVAAVMAVIDEKDKNLESMVDEVNKTQQAFAKARNFELK